MRDENGRVKGVKDVLGGSSTLMEWLDLPGLGRLIKNLHVLVDILFRSFLLNQDLDPLYFNVPDKKYFITHQELCAAFNDFCSNFSSSEEHLLRLEAFLIVEGVIRPDGIPEVTRDLHMEEKSKSFYLWNCLSFLKNVTSYNLEVMKELVGQLLSENASDIEFQDCHKNVATILSKKDYLTIREEALKENLRVVNNFDSLCLFHLAVQKGSIALVKSMIDGVEVDVRTGLNCTPLHLAVRFGHIDIAEFLLEKGADIEAVSFLRATPLVAAIAFNQKDMFKFLLGMKPKINGVLKNNVTALGAAVSTGDREFVDLLLEKGAQVGPSDLLLVAQYGHTHLVLPLLKAGADIEAKFMNDCTALHIAAQYGWKDIVDLLLRARADILVTDSRGETALHHAARNGHTEIVKTILRKEYAIRTISLPHVLRVSDRSCKRLIMAANTQRNARINAINSLKTSDDVIRFLDSDAHNMAKEDQLRRCIDYYVSVSLVLLPPSTAIDPPRLKILRRKRFLQSVLQSIISEKKSILFEKFSAMEKDCEKVSRELAATDQLIEALDRS